jgi:DNA polymerase III epsilon subunit-like protein
MIKTDTGENLLRYHWKDMKFLTLDFESECLSLAIKNKPWEVGYILIESGKITQRHNRRIWWDDLNISKDAARVTRFNYEDYKNTAEPAEEVLEEFESLLYDPSIINVTYNGLNFDNPLHQLWREKLGKPKDWSFLPRSIDVLALSRAYKLGMEPPEEWEDFFCWQYKLANYYSDDRLRQSRKKGVGSCTLSTMARELGVSVDDNKTHSGLYDVELTWAVLQGLFWKMNLTNECIKIK